MFEFHPFDPPVISKLVADFSVKNKRLSCLLAGHSKLFIELQVASTLTYESKVRGAIEKTGLRICPSGGWG